MIISATFSKPSKLCEEILGRPYKKIKIKASNSSKGTAYFMEMFTEKQVFHKKQSPQELEDFIEKNAGKTFKNCILITESEEISILANKKGKITRFSRKNPLNYSAHESIEQAENEVNNKNNSKINKWANSTASDKSDDEKNNSKTFDIIEKQASDNEAAKSTNNEASVSASKKAAGKSIKNNSFGNNRIKAHALKQKNESSYENPFTRQKNYLIPEGFPVPFMVLLGIMNPDGKVLNSKYDKFRQINRFLEFIDDIIPSISKNNEQPIRIADFGCGKSYLTFAVHYYLTQIKQMKVEIIGLDLKKDVIDYCNNIVQQLSLSGLHFDTGNIADYSYTHKPDIVITLHACDIATDFALEYAVKNHCKAILSVPCCQHEINGQLSKNQVEKSKQPSAFAPFLKYGLIKERFAALATDALRAEYLESMNYTVQILEFVNLENTPKNLMIRAVLNERNLQKKSSQLAASDSGQQNESKSLLEANALTDSLCITQKLKELLSL